MPRASTHLFIGLGSVLLGALLAAYNMVRWVSDPLSSYGGAPQIPAFYAAQLFCTVLIATGAYEVRRAAALRPLDPSPSSVTSILAYAITSRRLVKIGVAAALLYGVLYAFMSSIVVYQPGVDFAQAYGVSGPSIQYVACCGAAGSVPKVVVYLAPSLRLALQVAPLSLLFVLLVPALVGFNVMLSYHSVRGASVRLGGRWLAASGAVAGLFTACPTCAGFFLAGSIGGVGATSLALALASYQALFVAVSIPVLLVSPLLTALSLKRSYAASCRIPGGADARASEPFK